MKLTNKFTLVELLVAIAVMSFVASALAYTYSSTARLASSQVAVSDLNNRAAYVLDMIGKDLAAIRIEDVDGGNAVGIKGKTLTFDAVQTPYLTFVSNFVELDYDKFLLADEGQGGADYDGLVIGSFAKTEGLKEVGFYSMYNKAQGFFEVYRAIRGGSNGVLLNTSGADGANLHLDANKDNYRMAENVIYLGFSFLNNGSVSTTIDASTSDQFPVAVDVVLSMAANTGPGQWEGEIISASPLVVKKINGHFPAEGSADPGTALGYILIGDNEVPQVYEYTSVTRDPTDKDIYTFSGAAAPGFTVNATPGDSAIIGQTFKRSYIIK